MTKVIYVSGLLPRYSIIKATQRNIISLLEEQYDNVIFTNPQLYFFSSSEKIMKMKKDLIAEIECSQEDTILIGHSYGGVLIGSIDLKKYKQIKKVYLIASPINNYSNIFDLIVPFFSKPRKQINFNYNNLKLKNVYTVGFVFDIVVPYFMTKLNSKRHSYYFVDHFLKFLFSRKFPKRLFKELNILKK